MAFLATSQTPAAAALVAVVECQLVGQPGVVALALAGECGAGALAGGAVLRTPGWAAPTAAAAELLGWSRVSDVGDPSRAYGARAGALWRCRGAGAYNFSAGLESCAAAGAGFEPDAQLGFALAPLAELA
jgi:hypothetical protein